MTPTVSRRLLAALLLTLLTAAHATTYRELGFDEMLAEADIILYGTVDDVRVEERDGEPWTVVRFLVERALRGAEEGIEPLELAFFGGSLPNGVSARVALMPSFTIGETVLLFAYGETLYSPIVGFRQGLWRLRDGVLVDETGRQLSLGVDGGLEADGNGAAPDDVLSALRLRLEGQP